MVRLFTAILLLAGLIANGQSIRTYSFSPAGASVSHDTYKVLWQIGGITQGASAYENTTVYQDYFSNNELVAITGSDNSEFTNMLVYPNPASDFINIEFTSGDLREYQLIDTQGNVIKNISIERFGSIDKLTLDNLANGLYLLSITSEGDSKPVQIKLFKR